MLLASGFWMFVLHTSLNLDITFKYYEKKSFFGILEIVTPHLFGMSIVFFILTHFLAVVKNIKPLSSCAYMLFIVTIASNVSSFFIHEELSWFSLVKLFSTLLLLLCSIWIMFHILHLFRAGMHKKVK